MDGSEAHTKLYLDSLGLGEAVYEPDGKVPPDFVLDRRIAIEVRRLNQNFEQDGTYRGLESDAAPFYRFFEKVLPTFGASQGGAGWWVSYHFRRPFDARAIKRELPKVLKRLSDLPVSQPVKTEIAQNFTLELRPDTAGRAQLFTLASYIDFDAGGWLAAEVIRNLNICILEKEQKIAPYKHKYSEWWLVLPDFIGTSLDQEERNRIPPHIKRGTWDRIILLDPRSPLRVFEI